MRRSIKNASVASVIGIVSAKNWGDPIELTVPTGKKVGSTRLPRSLW
jgi:hypothetical protein